jgi:peroxiredoxin
VKPWSLLLALGLACKPDPALHTPETTAVHEPEPEPVPAEPVDTPVEPDATTDPAQPPLTDTPPTTDTPAPAAAPPIAANPPAAASEALPPALHTKVDARCGRDPGVDTPAKPFNLKTPDGKQIELASYRGKVVLLNFWGTWCKPCLKELPEFDRLYRRYRKHGLVLIAIATDTEPQKVLEFARERKLAAKLALGGEPLADQYESTNFPFSFVIDARGQIRGSYRGYKPECAGKLEQDIRAQLETLP